MKNITDNALGGLGEIFTSPLSDGEEASLENTSAVTDEITAEENTQSAEAASAEETVKAEGTTGFDFSGILGGGNNEETASAAPPTVDPDSGAGVQMPIALLVTLIAIICILSAVTIFLISKMKKTNRQPTAEYRAQAAEPPVSINVNQNMTMEDKVVAEIQSDSEKTAEKEAENMYRLPNVPVTVVPNDADTPHKLSYEIGNVHNQGRREEQQDSFCISDVSNKADLESKGLMAVVADGMGGLESGASVSQLVSNIFLNKYRSNAIPDCKSFLYEAVLESEREVEKYIEVNHVDGGSTLVAVMIREGQLSFISVGDSFIFLIRAGKLIKLNTEHTYGNLLRERAARGEIDPEEAEINPKRSSLTSYIGIGNLRLINQSGTPIPMLDGDILFLCSDGVYNALGDNALLETVTGGDFAEAAERVEQSVLMRNIPTQDNFTAVMIKITGGK